MRKVLGICIGMAILNGCSTLSREAGYPGGNVGYLADRYALFAQGNEQQVNRYLVALALVAPFVAETVGGSAEAKLSAERIKTLYQSIAKLETAASVCKPVKSDPVKFDVDCSEKKAGGIEGSALSFQTLSHDVNKSLNDAMKQAFDNLEIKSNTQKLLALDPTEMFRTILKARHLVPVVIRYLSTYRDVSIVFGLSVIASCHDDMNKPNAECQEVTDRVSSLTNRERTADSTAAQQERPISEVFKAGKEALDKGLDWKIPKIHRAGLLYHVNRACLKLDALARIDYQDFDGCEVDIGGTGNKEVKNDSNTQKAVNKIINEAPPMNSDPANTVGVPVPNN